MNHKVCNYRTGAINKGGILFDAAAIAFRGRVDVAGPIFQETGS